MSRRREVRRWHVGDEVRVPSYYLDPARGWQVRRWTRTTVVAIRGDHVITAGGYRWEGNHPAYEARPVVHTRAPWRPVMSHDTSKTRIRR